MNDHQTNPVPRLVASALEAEQLALAELIARVTTVSRCSSADDVAESPVRDRMGIRLWDKAKRRRVGVAY